MGITITGVLVAFVFPILTNFIQLHVGIFSIAVLVMHLVLIILAWNAHLIIAIGLWLVEKLYNMAFQVLLVKLLDDAHLDDIVEMILDPAGAGQSALRYVAGAVVDTVLSPVAYFTASGGDVEKSHEEAHDETDLSSGDRVLVVDDSENPEKAEQFHEAGRDPDTVKNFMSALKKGLVGATYMEFALPASDASQASKDESSHAPTTMESQ
mmetsp:Transcript_99205/g.221446  ORF Transcript_99205/g.221446 Transcript_99205/m.221446 type:complete len:210 (+) Transcript_99205:3-632(+)